MNKKQVFNPYLPLYEYVPDGEPHVFNDRVYLYGSHDEAGSVKYCTGDYVVWSAPINDLSDWKYEGEVYKATQDPSNPQGKLQLWAPDVARGKDGRYYLYYCLSFHLEIGVAVSDSPAGPFEFYGHVKYPENLNDGNVLSDFLPFDPAIFVDDDDRIFLYYGFAPAETNPDYPIVPSPGSMVVELEKDMCTTKGIPTMLIPGGAHSQGTTFQGHAFYEASSMRKIGETYYFIYSSELGHELCFAMSKYPDKGFAFGGIIVSNGDLGYNGREKAVNMTGNNHGSIEKINGKWYVFYHRQTHGTETSRQGCAEPITLLPNGKIEQVEITSCGLNGGPLKGEGSYSAAIACHLTGPSANGKIIFGQDTKEVLPYIFEESKESHFVANMTNNTVVGFKYFEFTGLEKISLQIKGKANGTIIIYHHNPEVAADDSLATKEIKIDEDQAWLTNEIVLTEPVLKGVYPIYIRYVGEGYINLKILTFSR